MTQAPYPSSALNPKDVRAAIHAGDAAIDAITPGGVTKSRAVLDAMVGAANEAIVRQQSGGSGHSK